jgi:hypothetical protein
MLMRFTTNLQEMNLYDRSRFPGIRVNRLRGCCLRNWRKPLFGEARRIKTSLIGDELGRHVSEAGHIWMWGAKTGKALTVTQSVTASR